MGWPKAHFRAYDLPMDRQWLYKLHPIKDHKVWRKLVFGGSRPRLATRIYVKNVHRICQSHLRSFLYIYGSDGYLESRGHILCAS